MSQTIARDAILSVLETRYDFQSARNVLDRAAAHAGLAKKDAFAPADLEALVSALSGFATHFDAVRPSILGLSGAKADAKADKKDEPKADAKADKKDEPKAAPAPEPEATPAPEPEAAPAPEAKDEPKADKKDEPKPEADKKDEPKADHKHDHKGDNKGDNKGDKKPSSKMKK